MRCVAIGCQTGRKSGVRIHSFPRDPKRRLEWAVKVNIAQNGKLWVPPKDSKYGICEAHFEEDQYEPKRTDRRLRPFAVPTLFSHRKVPKRRRKLVRCNPPSTTATTTITTTEVVTVSTVASLMNDTTVPTVMAPESASSVPKSQPSLLRSATNNSSLAGQAQCTQVTPSPVSKVLTLPVNSGPPFTEATSGGNVVFVPAASQSKHHYIAGNSPVVMTDMRAPPIVSHEMVPNATMPYNSPVLPTVNCLPSTGSIIVVPISKPNVVPVPSPVTSTSSQVPIILSVQSLAHNPSPPVSKASCMMPILANPTSYEKLQVEATALRQQTDVLRREVIELSRQAARVKASLARQTERLSRFLRMDQVEYLQRLAGDRPTRWTEPTLRFALDIYCCSPEAYRKLLFAHYPLPPETALKIFCIENGVREGVPPELLHLQTDSCPVGNEEEEDGNVNIVWL
ncbi:hypothetical protein HPB50_022479 [Hyalomma asiaticum]|uniref:Uncharacterized protein n=1 Tax=Hyalomma asiaticum TaxID=266040 RepID=A0ACB7S2Q9_HYAAI|nr:hypothetical protein HPB50_022479 [Hyalomma asiaticum]